MKTSTVNGLLLAASAVAIAVLVVETLFVLRLPGFLDSILGYLVVFLLSVSFSLAAVALAASGRLYVGAP